MLGKRGGPPTQLRNSGVFSSSQTPEVKADLSCHLLKSSPVGDSKHGNGECRKGAPLAARDLPRLVSPSALIAQIPRLLFPHPSRRLTRCPGAQRAQPDICWLMDLVTDETRGPGAIVLVDRNLVYHYITRHHNTVPVLFLPQTSQVHFHPMKRSGAEGRYVYGSMSMKPLSLMSHTVWPGVTNLPAL